MRIVKQLKNGLAYFPILPHTVGQDTGFTCDETSEKIFAGDRAILECWNGGDGISEPSHTDKFEGIVIWCQPVGAYGLQTDLCSDGEIECNLKQGPYDKIYKCEAIHDQEGENG